MIIGGRLLLQHRMKSCVKSLEVVRLACVSYNVQTNVWMYPIRHKTLHSLLYIFDVAPPCISHGSYNPSTSPPWAPKLLDTGQSPTSCFQIKTHADQKKARNQQTKTVNFEGGETRVNWQLIELGKHSVDQEEKWLPSSPPWPA